MVKNYTTFINEDYVPVRRNEWNHSSFDMYMFYMVKIEKEDGDIFEYGMTEQLLYDKTISEELGYNNEDKFKKFVYGCFVKDVVPDIINEYSKYYNVDEKAITVMTSPKWVLLPAKDGSQLRPWMNNVFNDANKMVNAKNVKSLGSTYEKYKTKYLALKEKYIKQAEQISKERDEKLRKEYEEYERKRLEAHDRWWNSLTPGEKEYYGYGYGLTYGLDGWVGD